MAEKITSIARQAGSILMKYHLQELDIKTKEHEFDFVTQADLESDKYIRAELEREFPSDNILSEEFDFSPDNYSGRVWMVDPLDGTKDFVNNGGGFSVMIGLCVNGVPVEGVVYAPARDLLYYAKKDMGAYVESNGERRDLRVSSVDDLKSSSVVTRFIQGEKRDLDRIVDSLDAKKEIPESSVGIKLGLIAEGKADLHVNTNYRCSKWDTCAPQVILEEAGGKITSFSGEPLDYKQESLKWENSFVASNSLLHENVVRHINSFLNK